MCQFTHLSTVTSQLFVLLLQIYDIFCQAPVTTTTVYPPILIRLANGANDREGRVELFYGDQWGTICSDGWDVLDAAVVCRIQGYVGSSKAVKGSAQVPTDYGPGTGPIFMRGVQCDGNELKLTDCQFQGWSVTECTHNEDAGVICLGERAPTTTTKAPKTTTTTLPPKICDNPNPNVTLRLADNSAGLGQGRVLYLRNNQSKGVCDIGWGYNEAAVVCRMLCYNPSNARAVLGNQAFGNASSEGFWFFNVRCTGAEKDLADCQYSNVINSNSCDVTHAAGVSCLALPAGLPILPTPVIDCDVTDYIVAKFRLSDEPRLLPEHLSVVSSEGGNALQSCLYNVTKDAEYVSIFIPYFGGDCNTSREINTTHVVYTNYVRYAVPSLSNLITRSDVYVIKVSCVVIRSSNEDGSFAPVSRQPPPQSGNGTYDVRLLLFEDATFKTVQSDNPLQILLGDWLYVGVQLYSVDPYLKLVLNSVYVSPSKQMNVNPMYFLIRNKCQIDSTVTLYPINETLMAFRFQSLKFLPNATQTTMFLHAEVNVCALSDNSGGCVRNCRSKRNVMKPNEFLYNDTIEAFHLTLEIFQGVSKKPIVRQQQ